MPLGWWRRGGLRHAVREEADERGGFLHRHAHRAGANVVGPRAHDELSAVGVPGGAEIRAVAARVLHKDAPTSPGRPLRHPESVAESATAVHRLAGGGQICSTTGFPAVTRHVEAVWIGLSACWTSSSTRNRAVNVSGSTSTVR